MSSQYTSDNTSYFFVPRVTSMDRKTRFVGWRQNKFAIAIPYNSEDFASAFSLA